MESILSVYALIGVVCAILTAHIGASKGGHQGAWLLIGFLLGPIGLIAALLKSPEQIRRPMVVSEAQFAAGQASRADQADRSTGTASRMGCLVTGLGLFALLIGLAVYSKMEDAALSERVSQKNAARQAEIRREIRAERAAAESRPAEWRRVKEWSGSGMKQTETFSVAGDEWRINWASKPDNPASIFAIYVYDEHGKVVNLAANVTGEGSDLSYIRSKGRHFYLQISAANTNWAVIVEDQH